MDSEGRGPLWALHDLARLLLFRRLLVYHLAVLKRLRFKYSVMLWGAAMVALLSGLKLGAHFPRVGDPHPECAPLRDRRGRRLPYGILHFRSARRLQGGRTHAG